MSRIFQIVVNTQDLSYRGHVQLTQSLAALKFNSALGANSESVWATKEVPPTMSDAEAAHYLSWRASDLTRLKFSVFSRSIIWREEA